MHQRPKRACAQASRLGSGRWVVRYFEGIAAWQAWGAAGNIVRSNNNWAGQTYDVQSHTVENYAEIAGPQLHVRASGTFAIEVCSFSTASHSSCVRASTPMWFNGLAWLLSWRLFT